MPFSSRLLLPLMFLACAGPEVLDEGTPDPVIEEDPEPTYSEDALLVDFGQDRETRWYAVNDTVMGGVSSGRLVYEDETLLFEGTVSTDSNGGFTSVRGPNEIIDISMYERVLIRMRSEGQPFSLILAHNPYWFQDQFKYDIEVPNADWNVIEIPLAEFQVYRTQNGYPSPTGIMMTPEDGRRILHLELMSKLFEDGDFRLEVDYIAFD